MQTLENAARLALALPGVTEGVDKHRHFNGYLAEEFLSE